jgi:hypothetical protein
MNTKTPVWNDRCYQNNHDDRQRPRDRGRGCDVSRLGEPRLCPAADTVSVSIGTLVQDCVPAAPPARRTSLVARLSVCVSTCLCVHSWPSQGELEDEDEDNDGVPRRLSFCEDAEIAVQLMTDKTLENVIMDDLLQKWTPAQLHHR